MTRAAQLRLGPRAAQAFVALFGISTAFPVVAALLAPAGTPAVLGSIDVIVAAAIIVLGFAIESTTRDRVTDADRMIAWRIVRIAASVPLLLLIVFFVRADLVRWDVLLVGLAWRTWLIIWVLPSVVAMLRASRRST